MKGSVSFTLIELLIVVSIIGILAAIAVPNFINALHKARHAQLQANFKTLKSGMMTYQVDWGSMPLHSPAHLTNIWNNALTTPVSYLSAEPIDVYETKADTDPLYYKNNWPNLYLHPDPFYRAGNLLLFGHPNLDEDIPAPFSDRDLTWRFADSPLLRQQALKNFRTGRYILSIGPDLVLGFVTYDVSNGVVSNGDIVYVVP